MCGYIMDANGLIRHYSPSTGDICAEFIQKGATVIVDELFWGSFEHVQFFTSVGWDYLGMADIPDGLAGLDPEMRTA